MGRVTVGRVSAGAVDDGVESPSHEGTDAMSPMGLSGLAHLFSFPHSFSLGVPLVCVGVVSGSAEAELNTLITSF